jgi:hypothetical protein
MTNTGSLIIAVSKLDRVRAVLTRQLQSADELGARCGLPTSIVAACLRELRRRGEAEFVQSSANGFQWRVPAERDGRASDGQPGGNRKAQAEATAFHRQPSS